MKKIALFLTLALVIGMFAGCGAKKETASDGTVTISVGNWPAKEGTALDTKEAQKAAFEKANPNIKIEPDTWSFDLETYYPKAAAGLLPTTYNFYFTEGEKIIRGGYAMEMTDVMNKLGYTEMLNPQLMNVIGKDGKIYYVPENVYSQGIVYNVDLFKKAGLMNDDETPKAPRTWDELVEMAKIIKEKTGASGFAIPTLKNAGGWLFTSIAWSFGVDFMEQNEDGSWKATFDTDEAAQALQFIKDLKWKHDVFPANTLIDNGEYVKLYSTGQLGMMIGSPGTAESIVQYEMDKDHFGIMTVPAGPAKRVALVGGKLNSVSNKSTPEQLEAAFKWFEYTGISPFLTDAIKKAQQDSIELAKAEDRAIGMKSIQMWNEKSEVTQNYNKLVEENANVNINHFKGYNDDLAAGNYELQPEEPVCCQDLYGILDNCIQKVLSDKNADCRAIMKQASEDFQKNYLDTMESVE